MNQLGATPRPSPIVAPCILIVALSLCACAGEGTGGGAHGSPDVQSDGRTQEPGVDVMDDTPSVPAPDAETSDAGTGEDSSTIIADSTCAGSACVTTTSCPSGAPAARFITQAAPPATVSPNQHIPVSVTFANCSGTTWDATAATAPTGYKLGSQSPQDNTNWGLSRVALPASVPSGWQVTIPFAVVAPPTAGTYMFGWGIVHEGVAWLSGDSPPSSITVGSTSTGPTTLCAGVSVNPTGAAPASSAIQRCINATPSGGTLHLPAGVYLVDTQILITAPITLTTSGTTGATPGCGPSGASCATLRASVTFDAMDGLIRLLSTHDVTLDHLVIDGNRAGRIASLAAASCAGGTNRYGFNATAAACTHCSFVHSASVNALCGSGFVWTGSRATVQGSVFQGNGQHTANLMWSDGLTLLDSDNATVTDNTFVDNSDVDLISGGSRGGVFERNSITQSAQPSFAGLMLDDFAGSTPGDFTGATVSGNTIQCGAELCDYGIELGPHAWYASGNIVGGAVTGNTIAGAKQGINVDGAGTSANPIEVARNTVTGSFGSATFLCGSHPTSACNIAPDSMVNRAGDTSSVTAWVWGACP